MKKKFITLVLVLVLALAMGLAACVNPGPGNNPDPGPGDNPDPVKYTVTFMNGTAVFDTKEVESGGTVSKPSTDPVKTDYTFDNWFETLNSDGTGSGAAFDFATKITKNTTLNAGYTKNPDLAALTDEYMAKLPQALNIESILSQESSVKITESYKAAGSPSDYNGTSAYEYRKIDGVIAEKYSALDDNGESFYTYYTYNCAGIDGDTLEPDGSYFGDVFWGAPYFYMEPAMKSFDLASRTLKLTYVFNNWEGINVCEYRYAFDSSDRLTAYNVKEEALSQIYETEYTVTYGGAAFDWPTLTRELTEDEKEAGEVHRAYYKTSCALLAGNGVTFTYYDWDGSGWESEISYEEKYLRTDAGGEYSCIYQDGSVYYTFNDKEFYVNDTGEISLDRLFGEYYAEPSLPHYYLGNYDLSGTVAKEDAGGGITKYSYTTEDGDDVCVYINAAGLITQYEVLGRYIDQKCIITTEAPQDIIPADVKAFDASLVKICQMKELYFESAQNLLISGAAEEGGYTITITEEHADYPEYNNTKKYELGFFEDIFFFTDADDLNSWYSCYYNGTQYELDEFGAVDDANDGWFYSPVNDVFNHLLNVRDEGTVLIETQSDSTAVTITTDNGDWQKVVIFNFENGRLVSIIEEEIFDVGGVKYHMETTFTYGAPANGLSDAVKNY